MDGRGDCDESVAIIGMACRFPGARDPAEFHDLAVAGRDMFQPVAALPGRPLRAAVLDDWSLPQIADDPVTGGLWPDVGPVRKLAAEMTALALTDAGLREVAGTCRTGLIIASSVPVLLQAYQRAGVDPADVQLIEGQGIGTAAGDSAELAALTQLRRGGC